LPYRSTGIRDTRCVGAVYGRCRRDCASAGYEAAGMGPEAVLATVLGAEAD